MAKDPAFLFYVGDFMGGVAFMDMAERGVYITLLCLQFQGGPIPKKRLGLLVGFDWDNLPKSIREKFTETEDDKIFNERLEEEREKRRKFTEKQRINGKKGGRPKGGKKPKENPSLNPDLNPKAKPNKSLLEDENINRVIEYLNKVSGKKYGTKTKPTRKVIRARLNDGYTVEQIKTVIDRKVRQWKGTEQDKYIRPETLFGNKFEGYYNESDAPATGSQRKSGNALLDQAQEIASNLKL